VCQFVSSRDARRQDVIDVRTSVCCVLTGVSEKLSGICSRSHTFATNRSQLLFTKLTCPSLPHINCETVCTYILRSSYTLGVRDLCQSILTDLYRNILIFVPRYPGKPLQRYYYVPGPRYPDSVLRYFYLSVPTYPRDIFTDFYQGVLTYVEISCRTVSRYTHSPALRYPDITFPELS
jgi:hypothetical protein